MFSQPRGVLLRPLHHKRISVRVSQALPAHAAFFLWSPSHSPDVLCVSPPQPRDPDLLLPLDPPPAPTPPALLSPQVRGLRRLGSRRQSPSLMFRRDANFTRATPSLGQPRWAGGWRCDWSVNEPFTGVHARYLCMSICVYAYMSYIYIHMHKYDLCYNPSIYDPPLINPSDHFICKKPMPHAAMTALSPSFLNSCDAPSSPISLPEHGFLRRRHRHSRVSCFRCSPSPTVPAFFLLLLISLPTTAFFVAGPAPTAESFLSRQSLSPEAQTPRPPLSPPAGQPGPRNGTPPGEWTEGGANTSNVAWLGGIG